MKKRGLKRLILGVFAAGLMFSFKLPNDGISGGGAELSLVKTVKADVTTVASGTCGTDATWSLDSEGKLTITGSGAMADYTNSTDAPWNNNKSSIKTVVIESGITSIGKNAFYSCSELTSVSIPSGVTSIGDGAFGMCEKLTSVSIPSGVTSIGNKAFDNCESLSSIDIPNTVTSIGNNAFYHCYSLGEVKIPEGVKTIGDSAFEECYGDVLTEDGGYCTKGFTKLWIPKSATSIGTDAFKDCNNLERVYIAYGKSASDYKGQYGLKDDMSLFTMLNEDGTIPDNNTDFLYTLIDGANDKIKITKYVGTSTEISIPEVINGYTVVGIDKNAFIGNGESARIISIPKSVETIDDDVFFRCSYHIESITVDEGNTNYVSEDGILFSKDKKTLVCYPGKKTGSSYEIPSTVTSIGIHAFDECQNLTSITIPSSVTSIGDGAFCECTNLTSITIPSSVTSIGDGAFSSCTNLTSITIPSGVTSIGDHTFQFCSKLTSVTIPNSVTSIGNRAFHFCSCLKSIAIPASVTKIDEEVFERCNAFVEYIVSEENNIYASKNGVLFSKDMTTLVDFPYGKQGCYEVPSTVVSIGSKAFEGNANISSIVIPNSVTSIADDAFFGNNLIEHIHIPNGKTVAEYKGKGKLPNDEAKYFVVDEQGFCSVPGNNCPITKGKNQKVANVVAEKVNAIGIVTLDSESGIADARTAYEALTADQKELVGATVVQTLSDAETRLATLKADKAAAEKAAAEKAAADKAAADKAAAEKAAANQTSDVVKVQQVNDFTSRMYSVALGRTPDENGQKDWAENLLSGKMDGASLARGFICSEEYQNKNYSNEEYIETLYQTFMGRGSDADGKAYWVDKLNNGTPRTEVLAGFVNSREFGGICDDYGIARGTMEVDGTNIYNQNVRNFVLRNYNNALGRKGEVEGVEYWSYRINKGIINPVDVARSFFRSEEFGDKNLSDSDYVELLYQTFMGRSSDSDGKAYWINQLQSGKSRDEVMNGFAYSKEFGEIMSDFGL